MLRELTDYYRPKDLSEALRLLAQPHTALLAGGTELLARKDATIQSVVDLQDLGLDYVRADGDGLRIGAMTRLQTLVVDPAVRNFADGVLARGAELCAQHTERVSATVGGTHVAGAANHDLLVALLAVDAWASGVGANGEWSEPLLWATERARLLQPRSLVTEIRIPSQPQGARYAYERVARTPRDRAIVNVAIRLARTDDKVLDVRIAIGGVAANPIRLGAVEHALEGWHVDAPLPDVSAWLNELHPPSDHIASSDYRRDMVGVLLRRALRELTHA